MSHAASIATGLTLLVLVAGCDGAPPEPPADSVPAAASAAGQEEIAPIVVLPDLTRFEAAVEQQLREVHADLQAAIEASEASSEPAALAERYGDAGMRFHAYELLDTARACYANARSLAPGEFRWAYYLADAHRRAADADAASERYRAALELQADYVPAWVRLGELQLEANRIEQAGTAFTRALELDPRCAAAEAGLGQLAMEQGRFDAARVRFEKALDLSPGANSLHYQLAMAWRGLGEAERARTHLEQRGEVRAGVHDPLLQALDSVVTGARYYQALGQQLGRAGRYDEAVDALRQAVALSPDDPTAHYYLAIALTKKGDLLDALHSFERTLELDPANDRAHVHAGTILVAQGDDTAAAEHFNRALLTHADSAAAHLALAQTLQRMGRHTDAIPHYERVVQLDPGSAEARLGRTFAQVRMQRWGDAARSLEEDVAAFPDQPAFLHAQARLLAAAPDGDVRDGERALQVAQGLSQSMRNLELGETVAMALAETGRFDEASQWQRQLIELASRSGAGPSVVERITTNLERYESHAACRTPWLPDDPVFQPPRPQVEVPLEPLDETPGG